MNLDRRKNIYYWKSDRPFVHGNVQCLDSLSLIKLKEQLSDYLNTHFKKNLVELKPAGGQGNHVTFLAHYPFQTYFVRVENGPEKDDYMDVESAVLKLVNTMGIPSPKVYYSDNTRSIVPFALQVIEYIKSKDLNILFKDDELNTLVVAESVGRYIAQWQKFEPKKYGLFDPLILLKRKVLEGYHSTYRDYFFLNWDKHLDYLHQSDFLSTMQVKDIKELVKQFDFLLNISSGCLVHKDLALWNILGSSQKIDAFIDWSDAISGDDMDDLSLLGCFHSGDVLTAAITGFSKVKPLPRCYQEKFWLHLLRNIIFKAVIRVKGNYFNKPDSFFMNNAGSKDLKTFTIERITDACKGLKGNIKIEDLK